MAPIARPSPARMDCWLPAAEPMVTPRILMGQHAPYAIMGERKPLMGAAAHPDEVWSHLHCPSIVLYWCHHVIDAIQGARWLHDEKIEQSIHVSAWIPHPDGPINTGRTIRGIVATFQERPTPRYIEGELVFAIGGDHRRFER